MSKQSSAAKAIKHATTRGYSPEQTATLLHKFDLLAPELYPPKDTHGLAWELPDSENCAIKEVQVSGKEIWIKCIDFHDYAMTASQAHDLAAALLSAINHREDNNE